MESIQLPQLSGNVLGKKLSARKENKAFEVLKLAAESYKIRDSMQKCVTNVLCLSPFS